VFGPSRERMGHGNQERVAKDAFTLRPLNGFFYLL
jgi:hypothetical protein